MTFNPEDYSISINKKLVYGMEMFVGRVEEFPNISSCECTYGKARDMLIDAIVTLKRIADEDMIHLPLPKRYR